MLKLKKKGFTLVEIMVSMIILSLLASGLFSVMVSARYLISRSKRRVAAVEVAQAEIENKKQYVRDDTWDTGPLMLQGWTSWVNSAINPFYLVRYKVEADPLGGACRKVTVQVSWNEPSI